MPVLYNYCALIYFKCILWRTVIAFFIFVLFYYLLSDILFYCIWSAFGCCVSGNLPYDKQIASLLRFYSSSDWDEWYQPRHDTPTSCFLQVNMRFAYLFKLARLFNQMFIVYIVYVVKKCTPVFNLFTKS